MKLFYAIDLFVLELLPVEDIREVALHAIESGFDSPSLYHLADSQNTDSETTKRLFCKALNELRISMPSPAEAGLSVARRIAHDIIQNTITPYEGAKRIWRDIYTRFPELVELRGFVGFASEYEDDVKHQDDYACLIVKECKCFLKKYN